MDYNDISASGKWEPLLKGLREDYNLESFDISNLSADCDIGDGPECGRWKVYPFGHDDDIARCLGTVDVARIEHLLAQYVLGSPGNPFELFMEKESET